MKTKQKEYITQLILLLVAVFFIGVFAAFLVVANIGGDAVLVFEQGFARLLKIDLGLAILILNVVLASVVFIIDRKKINVGTVVVAFLLGPFLQLVVNTGWIYDPMGNIWMAILVDFLAIIGLSFSLALYIYANIGLSPFEAIVITIYERTKWRFALIKMTFDALLFIIGWLLGGVVGVGSIMTVVMLGPLIDLFTSLLKKTNWVKAPIKVQ